MIDINYKGMLWCLAIVVMMVLVLMAMVASSGCVSAAKAVYSDLTATPVPTPTPEPTPIPTIPTPIPTPIGLPILDARYVDPYMQGERWEGQWFKWLRLNVSGYKNLNPGIIIYRHAFLDYYTWYNNDLAQYFVQKPSEGKRYFVVWIHEEVLGENQTYDPSMAIFDEMAFRLQYKGILISPDSTYSPLNRIREFEHTYDYYNTERTGPFAYLVRYSSSARGTAGFIAERMTFLRMGPGNSIDGYVIYEVPKDAQESDLLIVGSFARFGSAYWRFAT